MLLALVSAVPQMRNGPGGGRPDQNGPPFLGGKPKPDEGADRKAK